MPQQLDRAELVRLLEGLGAEKDEDVLSAARAVHATVSDAGLSWDKLLIAERATVDSSAEDNATPSAPALSGAVPDEQEALRLIAVLLENKDISDALREELEGYREDITEGEFDESDRKYVQALYERLSHK